MNPFTDIDRNFGPFEPDFLISLSELAEKRGTRGTRILRSTPDLAMKNKTKPVKECSDHFVLQRSSS